MPPIPAKSAIYGGQSNHDFGVNTNTSISTIFSAEGHLERGGGHRGTTPVSVWRALPSDHGRYRPPFSASPVL